MKKPRSCRFGQPPRRHCPQSIEEAANSGYDSKETAPAGELRPLIRTPDGGACSIRVFLRSTPPSTGESKLPSRASFPEPLLNGQRAVGEASSESRKAED
jgi:hypothetical protein